MTKPRFHTSCYKRWFKENTGLVPRAANVRKVYPEFQGNLATRQAWLDLHDRYNSPEMVQARPLRVVA